MHYDVFNGDADGICALIQLRLAQALESTLITSIKRDIQLLDKFSVSSGDSITVLDISFQKNRHRVVEFLNAGASIFYVDHHQSGEIPNHPNLKTLIDTDSALCTSLLSISI
jgi:oligoribonuclease NrnB/cAMP/cGMP phosphodiesterase (DHH superfamily)